MAACAQSLYLKMRDGIDIAIDVLRPPGGGFDESKGLPCVLLQTRSAAARPALWLPPPHLLRSAAGNESALGHRQ